MLDRLFGSLKRGALSMACFLAFVSGPAVADDFAAVRDRIETRCEGLERSHIDCGCVGKRVATFLHVAPSDDFRAFTEADYARTLGERADLEPLAARAMGSDEQMLDLIAAYGPHGGFDIEYERGCVIEGAQLTQVPELPEGEVYESAFESCNASTGSPLFCQCSVAGRAALLSKDEYTAHFLSYSDYSAADGSMEGLRVARAAKMGISPDAYDALLASVNMKMAAHDSGDGGYLHDNRCHSLLYGVDDRTGAVRSMAARSAAGRAGPPLGLESIDVSAAATDVRAGDQMAQALRDEQQDALDEAIRMSAGVEEEAAEAMGSEDLAQIRSADGIPTATALLAEGCGGESGRSEAYCNCLANEFSSAVPASMSEGARRMAAMMLVGSGLDPVIAAQVANNASPAEQMEAARAVAALSLLPERCEAAAHSREVEQTLQATGSVRERYLAMCGLQFEDMGGGTCACAADHFDEMLDEKEWRMLIDIQVAELKGENGTFEQYAENTALTRAEAEQAIMSSPRLMQALMGVGPACMAGGFGPK